LIFLNSYIVNISRLRMDNHAGIGKYRARRWVLKGKILGLTDSGDW